ncbi:MAG: hypothetical protein IPK37_04105 [Austwickia sp.]|jgi:DNA polymerase-3 subunit epsilon|nr:MAG: hypothetical protein IPK37_04105 [Austwickia sp.]
MNGTIFALLLLATCAAVAWAVWPRGNSRAGAAPAETPVVAAPAPPPESATAGTPQPVPTSHDAGPPALEPPAPEAPEARGADEPRRTAPSRAADQRGPRSSLFAYGTVAAPRGRAEPDAPHEGGVPPHTGDYACVHAATTGFSAARERIVELAVVHCDATGAIQDTWTTLVDPRRDDIGGAALHGIAPGMLPGAPAFADVATELLTRCEERVVVAHNAGLLEAFLAAELLRVGVLAPTLPAFDLLRMAPLAGPAPNVRLATLARRAGRRRDVPSSALDDATLLAAILPGVLNRLGDRIAYPVAPSPRTALSTTPVGRHRRTAPTLPRPAGTTGMPPNGWLADLMTDLAMSAAEGHDPRLAAYLDALTTVLPTGRIVADEVKELTGAAVRAGYPATQLHAVLERLLESVRVAAFARGAVTQDQVRHLRAAALSLGIPTYFDDLVQAPPPPAPTPGSGTFSRPVRKPPPPAPPPQAPRCGHCLQPGHYTAACPKLRRRGGGRGPIGGVPGLGPIDPISPI